MSSWPCRSEDSGSVSPRARPGKLPPPRSRRPPSPPAPTPGRGSTRRSWPRGPGAPAGRRAGSTREPHASATPAGAGREVQGGLDHLADRLGQVVGKRPPQAPRSRRNAIHSEPRRHLPGDDRGRTHHGAVGDCGAGQDHPAPSPIRTPRPMVTVPGLAGVRQSPGLWKFVSMINTPRPITVPEATDTPRRRDPRSISTSTSSPSLRTPPGPVSRWERAGSDRRRNRAPNRCGPGCPRADRRPRGHRAPPGRKRAGGTRSTHAPPRAQSDSSARLRAFRGRSCQAQPRAGRPPATTPGGDDAGHLAAGRDGGAGADAGATADHDARPEPDVGANLNRASATLGGVVDEAERGHRDVPADGDPGSGANGGPEVEEDIIANLESDRPAPTPWRPHPGSS